MEIRRQWLQLGDSITEGVRYPIGHLTASIVELKYARSRHLAGRRDGTQNRLSVVSIQ